MSYVRNNWVHLRVCGSDSLKLALSHQCEEERLEGVPLACPTGGYNHDSARLSSGEEPHCILTYVHEVRVCDAGWVPGRHSGK
jgi:hypothetical protein